MEINYVPIAGPSGVGKTTCVKELLKLDERYGFSVSATDRPKRPGEIDGKDYHFFSPEEFQQKIQENEFVEWEEVYNKGFYGTLWSELQRLRTAGKICVLDVDVKGALSIKRRFPKQTFSVFLTADEKILEQQLRGRNTESAETLSKRLAKVEWEIMMAQKAEPSFDFIFEIIHGRPEMTLHAVRQKLLEVC